MRKLSSALILTLVVLIFNNCARYNQMVIFPELLTKSDSTLVGSFPSKESPLLIKPFYHLYVSFLGLDENNFGLLTKQTNDLGYDENSMYIESIRVNSGGYINLPIIGELYVLGKTVEEVEVELQKITNDYFKNVDVNVRLLSFELTLLGEVNVSSRHLFYNHRVNIIEAIATAGGVTTEANLSEILLIRENNGVKETYKLDLTSEKILEDELFWLKPNDIVYIKPQRSKTWRLNSSMVTVALSAMTSLTFLITYFTK